MDNLSTLANMAEVLGVIIVVGGLYFAILQIRQFRQQRRELAAIELFRFFGNPRFSRAYQSILRLPDGLSAADIRERSPPLEDAAMLVASTMENIGVMTFQHIVPFVIVNRLIGSSVVILWRKLEHWIIALRDEIGNDGAFEWFQWLAEHLEGCQQSDAPPAFEAYRDWKPANLSRDI